MGKKINNPIPYSIDYQHFGNRHFIGGNDIELYDPDRNTYDAFHGLHFNRLLQLKNKQNEEITIENILGYDLHACLAFHCLTHSLNNDNQIVIKQNDGRWIPARTSKELQKIAHIKNNDSWSKAKQMLIGKGIIAKSETKIRNKNIKCFVLNPLYFIKTNEQRISVRLINEFWDDIKQYIRDKRTVNEIEELISEENNPGKNDNSDVENNNLIGNNSNIIESDIIDDLLAIKEESLIDQEEALKIWRVTVLGGENPRYYSLIDNQGMRKTNYSEEYDMYYTPNTSLTYGETNPKDKDIVTYNAVFFDLDAGKDEKGNYLSTEEVDKRKIYFKAIVDALPLITIVNESRNGLQGTYAITDCNDKDTFDNLMNHLKELIKIADKSVGRLGQLMRVPASIWHKPKSGLPAYKTSIIRANDISYSVKELHNLLDQVTDKINVIVKSYQREFSINDAVLKTNNKIVNIKQDIIGFKNNKRLLAISNLSTDTFDIPKEQTHICDEEKYKYFVQKNLYDFLNLDVNEGNDFCDLFHDDHNPSAHIFNNGENGYRYICLSDSAPMDKRGWNIIDIIKYLSQCNNSAAVEYLCKIYNVVISSPKAA